LKRWTIDRLPRIDLTILRIAVYEMAYRPDIPANVAISEAVLLAKKYQAKNRKTTSMLFWARSAR
jgi:N utilization substance protein B